MTNKPQLQEMASITLTGSEMNALLALQTSFSPRIGCVCRMCNSESYAVGCTLRHPRILRVRDRSDKDFSTVNSMDDLQQKICAERVEQEASKPTKKRAPLRRATKA
jgi:hypothetical protein